jgi:hypothetical protein
MVSAANRVFQSLLVLWARVGLPARPSAVFDRTGPSVRRPARRPVCTVVYRSVCRPVRPPCSNGPGGKPARPFAGPPAGPPVRLLGCSPVGLPACPCVRPDPAVSRPVRSPPRPPARLHVCTVVHRSACRPVRPPCSTRPGGKPSRPFAGPPAGPPAGQRLHELLLFRGRKNIRVAHHLDKSCPC